MKHLLSIILLSGALFASTPKYQSAQILSLQTEVYDCNLWIETSGKILLDMSESKSNEGLILFYADFTYASERAIEECKYVDEDSTAILEEIAYDLELYMNQIRNNNENR